MSPRLDLPLAVAAWLVGFAWVGRTGSWTPLAALAVLAAARLLAGDPGTRRLLAAGPGQLAIGALSGLAMVLVTYAAYPLAARLFPGLPGATHELYGVLNASGYRPAALAGLVLLLSGCEEVIWRGRTLGAGSSGLVGSPGSPGSPGLAGPGRLDRQALVRVGVAALAYGLATLPSGSVLLVALAAACGLAWGLLRAATGSLWPAVVAHAVWDLAVLVAWPLA